MKKVLPGDRLKVLATTFNTMIDAARDFQSRQLNRSRQRQTDQRKADIISVRNDSGGDVGQFDVLEFSAPLFAPSYNAAEFKQRVMAKGVAPVEDGNGKFVVALEPIAKGKIGKAVVVGAAVARVRMASESHGYADVAEKRTNCLESGASGAARILWGEPEASRNETHRYKFDGTGTAGTFTLTLAKAGGGAQATEAIAWNAGRATVSSTIATALGATNTVAVMYDGDAIAEVWITYDGEGYAGEEWDLGTADVSNLTGVTGYEATKEKVAWAVLRLGGAGATPMVTARIVCNGPEGEPPPTTNNYWLQCTQLRGLADPDDPDEPPVTDLKEGDIFLAVNLAEQLIGTHGLRVGTEVIAWQQGDSAGASRWVFCLTPTVFLQMFGGLFSAAGIARCSELAYLVHDSWCQRTPVAPWNDPDGISIGPTYDHAEFHGRDETHAYTLSGKAKSGTFSLSLERHDFQFVNTDALDCTARDSVITGAIRRALQSAVTVKVPRRNEIHTYTPDAEPTAGTYTLTMEAADGSEVTTSSLDWDDDESAIEAEVHDTLGETVTVEAEHYAGGGVKSITIRLDTGAYAGRSWKTGAMDHSGLTGVTDCDVVASAEPLTALSIVYDSRLYMGRSWNTGTLDYSDLVGVTGCNVTVPVEATGGELHYYEFDATPTAGTFTLTLFDYDEEQGTTANIAWNASEATVQTAVDGVMGADKTRVEVEYDGSAIKRIIIHLSGTNYAHWSWPTGSADVSALTDVSSCSVSRDIWAFHFVAGQLTLQRGEDVGVYAFGYRRESESFYTGFDIEDDLVAGEGRCLCVYAGKLYLGQLGGTGEGVAETNLRRAHWNDHAAEWIKEDIGWQEEIGGTSPLPLNMMVVERNGAEELVVVGAFGDDADYHCIAFYNAAGFGTYFDPGGCGTGEGAGLIGLCLHDFGNTKLPRLVVSGNFATIGGLSGSPNVASYDLDADEWLPCSTGVTLAALTTASSVASFNHRLWLARGYSPLVTTPTGESLLCLPNGPGQIWRGASAFVKDLNLGGIGHPDGSGFWRHAWNGVDSTAVSAAINEVRVYGKRLMVGGLQQFRTLRRGGKYCGPVVGYDGTEKLYQGLRQIVGGEVYALLPFDGGLAVAGKFELRLSDGRILRNVAVWHEPEIWGDEGTWDDLGGGTDGPVYCLAVYNGCLHAGGGFHSAGGVTAKGLARWDAPNKVWHYTANFSDYGNVLALCVAGDDLIVAGDFQKADGRSKWGRVCAWNGEALSEVYTTMTAAEGDPIIRAVCYYDGHLYIGGWFDTLNGATIYSVARRVYPAYGAWGTLDNSGGSPPNGIALPGSVWSLCAHASRIYVGTEPGSKPNGESDNAALWTWNPASPDWAKAYIGVSWGSLPVRGLWSNGTYIYAGVEATRAPPVQESFGLKHRIYVQQTPGSTPDTLGSDGDGPYFEHAVLAVCYCDAGGGDRPFAGGSFQSVGAITSPASKTCNLITSIGEDDRIHDVRGGLGLAGYFAQFTSAQWVQRMRPFKSNDVECERLAVCGNFSTMNEYGMQHLCGVNLQGQLVGVAGGLSGSNRYNQVGEIDGPRDIKAIPRAEWPAYWEALFTAREAEPYLPFLHLIGGSLSRAVNDDIPLADQEDVDEVIVTPGIVAHYGDYCRAILPSTVGLPQYCRSVAVYDGKLVHLGADTPPHYWDGDEESGDWLPYVAAETAGALALGEGRHLIVWDDKLFTAGRLQLYPDIDPGDDVAAVAEFDGADYTLDMISGLGAADAEKHGNHFLVADLNDGQGECLFLAAQPSDPETMCPVYRLPISGAWTAVGGASQLRGTAYALAVIMHDDGRRLVAQGALQVKVGEDWIECAAAMWNGSSWTPIAWIGEYDIPYFRMTSDTWGYAGDEQDRSRAVACGMISEFAANHEDIGTSASAPGYGMVAVAKDGSISDLPRGRGVNGLVMAAESAARSLFAEL